jgi:hypothetical protein
MITGNTENGLVVTYDDSTGKLNFDVNDPVLSISGDATGAATMTNLGNTDIVLTLTDESVQDIVGAMVSTPGNTETGISVDYRDSDGTIDFVLTADPIINLTGDATGAVTLTNLASSTFNLPVVILDDSHNHVIGNIDDFTENVQDIVGNMVNPTNIESGIAVTYDDTSGKLNFDVHDPTITLSGDVTSSAITMTNLGSVTIPTTLNLGSDAMKETIQDIVGAMVSGNTESGIVVTYDDAGTATGKLDFNASSSHTIGLTGNITGSAVTITNASGSHNINVTGDISVGSTSDYKWTNGSTVESLDTKYAANSHTHAYAASGHDHDGSYYLKSAIDQGGSLATTHNAGGKKTINTGSPSGGSSGDIHYQTDSIVAGTNDTTIGYKLTSSKQITTSDYVDAKNTIFAYALSGTGGGILGISRNVSSISESGNYKSFNITNTGTTGYVVEITGENNQSGVNHIYGTVWGRSTTNVNTHWSDDASANPMASVHFMLIKGSN